ncbi:MAG: hypothetical protein AB7O45_02020 [Alphaproteobacteria bacterium]
MRVVPIEAVPEIVFAQPRAGRLMMRSLLSSEDGTADDFVLYTLRTPKEFFSPRHRHNFDQVRLQLAGHSDFGDGRLTPGKIGYFPEGTHYGPQTGSDDSTILLLQFGGASGQGHMSHAALEQAMSLLKRTGTFGDGVYTWHDANGQKHNKDGYQAAWEARNGRPMAFAPARFDRPVFMNPNHFDWQPVDGEPGVRERALGEFNQRRTSISLFALPCGSVHAVEGGAIVFVIAGSGIMDGARWHRHSSAEIRPGERARFAAEQDAELLAVRMPWSRPAPGAA